MITFTRSRNRYILLEDLDYSRISLNTQFVRIQSLDTLAQILAADTHGYIESAFLDTLI